MSAMERRNFFVLLPFTIGDVIDSDSEDKMWANYIRLLKITLLVMSPFASFDTVETLEQLIYSYQLQLYEITPRNSPISKTALSYSHTSTDIEFWTRKKSYVYKT